MKRVYTLLFCLWSICCVAAPHNYMFKHLEVKDGLSNNQVNAIYKDSGGFMWFGTASGLNRYDGYNIKVYRSQQGDAFSLPDNYIEDIQEDGDKNLWIRTGAGYALYNYATDCFDRKVETWMWNIGITGKPASLYIDKEQTLWVYVAGKSVYRYQKGADAVEVASVPAQVTVTDITECSEGILLVYNNGTLVCLDRKQPRVKWTVDHVAQTLGRGKDIAFSLFVDSNHRVWMYSVIGMWVYNLSGKNFTQSTLGNEAYNIVRTVAQDKHGCLWIGRDQDGVELIDTSGRRLNLANQPNNRRTLSNNTVTALYEDSDGTMWVGTYKKGVSYYNESSFKFGLVDMGDINCVEDGKSGIVWLGTNGSGLIRWNTLTDEQKVWTHTPDARSLSSDVVVSLLQDTDGRLWVGTYRGGLNCYDGHRFVQYRASTSTPNALAHDNVWALLEDREHNLWIATLGGGVQCLDPRTGTFTTYNTVNAGLVSDFVSSLCFGADNTLVIGTSSGLSILDLATRKIKNLTGTRSGEASFSNQNITQVYQDSRGLLWLATREGLNVYEPQADKLYEVPLKSDFSRLFVLGITEDNGGGIWVSTGGELINVVLSKEAGSGAFDFRCYSYNDKDGLQNCDFNQRSLKRLGTGEIVVGGLNGLNRFKPHDIKYNRTLPRVMFTAFQLFNEEIKVGQEYGGHVVLSQSLNQVEEVVLNYEQNVFTVLFASDNYVLPQKTCYYYKLEGFNNDWMPGLPDMHRVTYTNLAPGTYLLKIKATNSDGYVGDQEACLRIRIRPPFWLTPWAYTAYLFLLMGALGLAYYGVRRRERNKFKIQQMEQEACKTEEINQMKFRFFTNVSHELRTPLTLIISPLEGMMKEVTDERKLDKLRMMHRNALRLLNLVNQLLDFRKNEMAGLHLTLSEGDIVTYVQNICHSFLMLSEKKNVHLTFYSAVETLNMAFDEDKVGKVVMNLLSNAFKFTPDGGRVDVSLELLKGSPETLEIKVSDTGYGIKDADKERVFERFYQVEHEGANAQSTGSGIGLSLVRDFVTLHGGAVRVFDNVGSGSVFVVDIPVKHSAVNVATPLSAEAAAEDALALSSPVVSTDDEDTQAIERKKSVVLIVDDNEDFVAFLKDSLSLYFTVQSASNGREAWNIIPTLMPHLIISDLMMPQMDGNELCRWVKTDKRTENIPFILLTAKQSVENKVEGLTIGADDYVTKPFNMEVLILRMRKLIELSGRSKLRTRIDPEPSEIVITSLDEKLIENAIKYVETNISRSDLSVEELSHELNMSRVHLYKKLLLITGKTPIEFIRIIRLKRAAQLLRESQQNVSEIAYQLGFNNPKYFSKYFKDEFGVLPSVYQEKEGK